MTVLLFDRCTGIRLVKALRKLRTPFEVACWQEQFSAKGQLKDPIWLPEAAHKGWIVITFDNRFDERLEELQAIVENGGGCFCLWGGSAPTWDRFCFLIRCLPRILKTADVTVRPFVFRVDGRAHMARVDLEEAARALAEIAAHKHEQLRLFGGSR